MLCNGASLASAGSSTVHMAAAGPPRTSCFASGRAAWRNSFLVLEIAFRKSYLESRILSIIATRVRSSTTQHSATKSKPTLRCTSAFPLFPRLCRHRGTFSKPRVPFYCVHLQRAASEGSVLSPPSPVARHSLMCTVRVTTPPPLSPLFSSPHSPTSPTT